MMTNPTIHQRVLLLVALVAASSRDVTAFVPIKTSRMAAKIPSSSIPTSSSPTLLHEHNYDYDMVTIGGGSGGVRASRIATGHGAKVLLIETQLTHGAPNYSAIGGTCVNVGCVPKKLMVFAARYPGDIQEAAGYGWQGATPGTFDWKTFLQAKNEEISRLNNVYNKFVLGNAGVEIAEGNGKLIDDHTIQITHPTTGDITRTVTADKILIAVGGWPSMPSNIPGVEHAISSNEIFYLDEQPKRIVVVGGGYIALEFACIMDGLGSDVTLLYRGDLFLRGFDQDVREHMLAELTENTNIDIQLETNPEEIIKNHVDGSLTVVTDTEKKIDTDCVLMATGRQGKTESLGLETVGVNVEKSFVHVNDYSQTNVDHIYAVGDVTNRMALTPVALMEGHCLADTVFGGMDRPVDHTWIASTVFTTPEVATIGYTEEQAAAKFQDIAVYKTRFRPMKHSFPKSETYTFFKLIVDSKTNKVIGCHLVTDGAGEMMQGVAVAVKMGATKHDFDNCIGIHPTSAEELVTMRTPAYHYQNGVKVEE